MVEIFNGDVEAIALAAETEKVIKDLAAKLMAAFSRVNANNKMSRADLKEVDVLFAKSNNLMSRLGLKKITGVINEQDIQDYRSQISELRGYYNDLVAQIDNLNPASKDPKTMTMEEVVEVLERLVDSGSDYYAEVNQRFLELISGEKPLKEAEYRCKRAFQAILAKGDTGEKDFGVWFPEVTNQLINKTTNFIDEGRYLFTKHTEEDDRDVTLENIDELPIDEDALAVWDYVIDRIKGKYGGLVADPEHPYDPNDPDNEDYKLGAKNYDYNSLSGDNIKNFEEHLKRKFSNVNEEILQQIIKFCQSHDAKTTAYTAWLARETTRSHGAGPAKLRGEKFEDPLFTVAFFAAGIYGRGRYGNVIPNSSSPDLALMPKDVAVDIIPENRDGSLNEEKRASSAALWEIVNSFYTKIMWRGTPNWIQDVRSLFGINENDLGLSQAISKLEREKNETNDDRKKAAIDIKIDTTRRKMGKEKKEIDLYKTMFPMPGEVTVDAYKVELEKRKLDESYQNAINLIEEERTSISEHYSELTNQFDEEKTGIIEHYSELINNLMEEKDGTDDDNEKDEIDRRMAEANNEMENDLAKIDIRVTEAENQYEADNNAIDRRLVGIRREMKVAKKEFIEKYSKFGYGSTFEEIGITRLTKDPEGKGYNLSVGQYDTAFRAMGEMSEFFHQPFGKMNFEQCVEKFKHWMDKIVGKAKLVPGRHFVLFPYMTMFAIDKIISVYELRDTSYKVNSLVERLRSELEQAGGVPVEVKDKLLGYEEEDNGRRISHPGYLETDKQSFGVFPTAISSRVYKQDLYRFKTRVMNGLEEQIRRFFPLGWFAKEEDDSPMRVTVPWTWGIKVDKDTSGK